MGGLAETAQSGSAVAITEAVALAWESADTDRLALEHPQFATNLLRARTRQLADAQHRIAELTTARAEQRVALALLRLAEASGQELTAQNPTQLPISREDVAQMAGTTLYTASRVMSGWEREGLLELGRQRVVILATHDLQRRARS
jgi:CRP-like cAMP-binding protein